MESLTIQDAFERIGFGKFHYILLLICGIIQSFDAIEMLLLAFIQPILRCVWQVTLLEESWLISGVFTGMMIGGPFFGRICDLYGRRSVLLITSVSLAYMGTICAASPSLLWIIIFRTCIGAFLGGIVSSLGTLTSELMPIANRGIALICILSFYSIGSYLIIIACVTIIPTLGWRVFLFITTLPVILTLPVLFWLPESPRFLLLKNKKLEAINIINRIAKANKISEIKDIIQLNDPIYSLWDIFHVNYLSSTFLIAFIWFVAGFMYYAILLIVTKFESLPRQCFVNESKSSSMDDSCCVPISWYNYRNALISTTGELVFIPLSMVLINVLGRKISLALFSLLNALLFIIINLCLPPLVMSLVLFILRGSINSLFNIIYIYTSEVFPTSVRSVALGLCMTTSRLGAIMSPFIVNFILMEYSFLSGTIIFIFFNLMAFIAILILPYETKNMQLYQTAVEFIIK